MPFELSQEQNNKLKELTENGNSNFPAGYSYLKEIIDGALKNNSLSMADKKSLEEQSFWLGKAIEINANAPDSEANTFIREVTRNGLAFDDKTATPETVQANSNLIANNVISGIIKDSKIPEITGIIRDDALKAIDKGGQSIGGWGGAFNYWDLSLDPNNAQDTVGNRILNNPVEYEKFLAVNSAAIAKTMGKFGITPEQVITALGSALSSKVMGDITNRLSEALTEGFGFAGDPRNIDGYKPSIGNDDKVTGWWSFDKDLKRVEVNDEAKIKELNDRYNVRMQKGIFHHWQDPAVGTKTQTLHLDDDTTVTQNFNDDGTLISSSSIKSDKTRTDLTYDPSTGKKSSQTDFNTDGTKTERNFDPETGVIVQENLFDGNGTQITAKTFDHVAGHLTAQTDFNVDGYRIEKTFAPASAQEIQDWLWLATNPLHGFVTQDKRTSLATGALVMDLRFDIQQRVFTSYFVEPAYQQLLTTQAIEPEMKRRQEEVRARIIDRLIESIPAAERDREGMREHAKEVLVNIEIGPIRLDLDPYSTEYEKLLQEFLGAKAKELGLNVTVGPVSASNDDGTNSSSGSDRGNGGDRRDDDSYQGSITVGEVTIGPVFLDLNSDKIIDPLLFSRSQNQLQFDWNADGIPDQTAWVGPNDGMLVIDLAKDGTAGADGVIDQPKEIAFALWKTEEERVAELKEKGIDDTGRPVTDLEGLRWAFDSNHDNVLDMRDARWNEFRVWQDANQNGVTDPGELLTMDQAGIRLINLMPFSDGSKTFPDGSAITGTSSAEMTDGTKMLVGDVSLAYKPSLAG